MRRPKRLLFAIPLTLALALTACSAESDGGSDGGSDDGSDAAAAAGGTFSFSGSEPEAFAPTSQCYSSDCSQIINAVFTGLLRVDPETSEPIYTGAESFESEDGQNWTITLKPDQTFHNGEPVTAESYVRAWNYAAYGPNATQLGFFFSKVEGYDDLQGEKPKAEEMSGLTVVDDLTFEVKLSEPFSQFPLTMSYLPAAAPMAEECMENIKACNEQPIGNGPYQFAEKWNHNQGINLEKYADYFDEETAGLADAIEYKIYADLSTAYRDFQGGNLDIVVPDPSQIPQARAQYADSLLEVDSGSYAYFGFPLYEEAFQNVDIRRALSLAIDRQAIIDNVLAGRFTPATDVISPFVPGSRDDACDHCVYDPEQAKTLYDEAGGIPGDKISIWFNNDGGHEQWVKAMAQGWQRDLGLDFEFKSQPFTPYLKALGTQSEVDGPYRLGWLPDYPSPQNYLDPLYGEGSSNYGKWEGEKHDEFLDLVAEGDAAPTIEEGLPSYQAAADIVLDEVVVIPLWFGQTFYVMSENVDNVQYSPTDQLLLTDISVTS
jgi:ABC-type oligopeptide transport system substrate-binding subunit